MCFPGSGFTGKTWNCCQSAKFQQSEGFLPSYAFFLLQNGFLHTQVFVLVQALYFQHVLLGHYPISALLNKPRNSWRKGYSSLKKRLSETNVAWRLRLARIFSESLPKSDMIERICSDISDCGSKSWWKYLVFGSVLFQELAHWI